MIGVTLLATLWGCGGLVEKSPGGSDGQLVGSALPGSPPQESVTPPGTPPALSSSTPRTEGFELGSFKADYFDGAKLVATEFVARPAVNYAWSDFHGIQSENFRAAWEGTLTATLPDQGVDINTDLSWSDAKLVIDGKEVPFSERVHQTFSLGTHSIRVEYANHWHTTGFNMSFTSNPVFTTREVRRDVAALVTADTRIAHIAIYEPSSFTNDVTVTVKPGSHPVFLVLSSYAATNWIIVNPGNVEIKGIAYGAYGPGPTVVAPAGVKTFELSDLRYEEANLESLVGRSADQTTTDYATELVTIANR